MFSEISWQQYFTVLILVTLLYYGFVWVVIYKAKLSFFRIKTFRPAEDGPDETMTTAQHVIEEIRPLFRNVSNRSEMMMALSLRLQKYADWNERGFRETVNQFIAQESQTKCSIRLSAEDQDALWKPA